MAGRRDAPSFADRGQTIDIHDSRSRESVPAALHLSTQKLGTISVRGDDEFKRTCVELAAEHGFTVTQAVQLPDVIQDPPRLPIRTRGSIPVPPGRSIEQRVPSRVVSVEEAAGHLSVSVQTIRRWCKSGALPYVRRGRELRIDLTKVRAIDGTEVRRLAR